MKPIPISPIGTRKAFGFRHHSDGTVDNEWDEPVYPPSPNGEKLRRQRVARELGLREAARMLGLKPSELSSLETGRAVLGDAGWTEVFTALRGDGGKGER